MIGVNSRISCKHLFKEFKILTLASLCLSLPIYLSIYILEVTCFIRKILGVSGAKL